MKRDDAIYLAGLIDGEGYIGVFSTGRGSFAARITIKMTHEKVVRWVNSTTKVGGVFFHRPKQKKWADTYIWQVSAKQAQKVATDIAPFLKVKKKQAENLIEFQNKLSQMRHVCRNNPRTKAERKYLDRYAAISTSLNKTGR